MRDASAYSRIAALASAKAGANKHFILFPVSRISLLSLPVHFFDWLVLEACTRWAVSESDQIEIL